MRNILLLFFFILLVILSGCTKDTPPESKESTEPEGHFSVYGLGIGDSVDEVTSELGIPDEKQVVKVDEEQEYLFYGYPHIFLGFKNDQLIYISSSDPEFETDKGIGINDDKRKAVLEYSSEDLYCYQCAENEYNHEKIPQSFYVEDGDTRLIFTGEANKINFVQVAKDLPLSMMFAHTINPIEANKEIAKNIEQEVTKLNQSVIDK